MSDTSKLSIPFWRAPSNLFVIKIVGVYVAWKVLHYYLVLPSSGILYEVWAAFVFDYGRIYAILTSALLNFIGQHTVHQGIDIVFTDHPQRAIWVQEHCLAIPAMLMFSSAIAFFQGNRKDKFWFIPLGLAAIFTLNLVRLVLLSLSYKYMTADFFVIYHSYIYVIITYSLILLLLFFWMKREG